MARILIVSQYFRPDITAAAHRITDLRIFLQSHGHHVDVITSFPHKAQVEIKAEDDYGVARVRLPIGATSAVGRLWEQSLFALKALGVFVRRFRKEGYQFVVASSPPLFVGAVGYVMARWTKAVFILDIRDIWPGSVAAAGVVSGSSFVIRLASRLERWLYRVADHITCVARPMKEYIEQYTEPTKIRVVYNGVDVNSRLAGEQQNSEGGAAVDDRSASMQSNQASEHSDGIICLAYTGNIGLVQDIDVLVDALKYVQPKTFSRLRIRIIGSGVERDRLEKLVAADPIASRIILFEGPYPKHVVSDMLSNGSVDALFIHLRSDPILDLTIPSKVFDSCLFNLPIVYGLSGEGHEILSRLPGTLYFRQGSARSLGAALDRLVEEYGVLRTRAQSHRAFVEKNFTREVCFRPFLDIISRGEKIVTALHYQSTLCRRS